MAAQAIGSLYAQLGLDTAAFDTGVAKARGKLNDLGKFNFSGALKAGLGEIEGALKSTAGQAGALGNILGGLGIAGTAAAAAIAVAFTGARSAMAFGDEIADTANKLRVTTDYLQEMRFAAHQLGGDFTDADEALEGFTKTFGLAKSGLSSKAIKPFASLGLDPKSFETVQQALDAVIDKISGLGDAAEQAAVADKLGLTPLLPAIREGTGAIDDLRKAAHDLGYVMDDSLIEKAGDANDQFEALQAVLDVQFKSAMVDAIPLVMQLTQWMVDAAKAAGEFAKEVQGVSDKFAYLGTHDLGGNAVKNDRDKLFGKIAQRNGLARIAAAADPIATGGVSMASLQALIGAPASEKPKPKGQLIDLEDKTRKAAEAQRATAAAERERVAALKALSDAMRMAEQRSADYAAGLLDDIATMGMSSEQVRQYRVAQEAAAAPTAALAKLITDLSVKYEAQAKVGREAADVQKSVNDQQSDNIRTIQDAIGGTITYTTWLGRMADDLEGAADKGREMRFAIEDIAGAINNNDWTSAFAGLINVLEKVDVALGKNATSLQKMQALAGVGMGVGSVIGGTTGAGISGAASGALAGFQAGSIIPGLGNVAGAVIGGLVGGLGSIFGSSKAKKKAKRQAEAQRAAEEAARQQQIADTQFGLDVAILRAQGKEQEALTKERDKEIARLQALSPALVDSQKQLWALEDAATAAAAAAEKAAAIEAKRQSIQDEIDKLTLSDSELLAKTRAKERAEAVALDPALGDLIDKLYGLQDSALASEKATAALQAANDAATRAAEQQASVMQGLADTFGGVVNGVMDLTRSLNEFGDSLGRPDFSALSPKQAYAASKAALNDALATGQFDLVQSLGQAFVEASRAVNGGSAAYIQDRAYAQSIAYSAAAANQGRLSGIGSIFSSLRGFATGGEMVIGGNTGLDRNILSINDAPVARVNYGETLAIRPAGANDNSSAAVVAELRVVQQQLATANARLANLEKTNERMDRNINQGSEAGTLTWGTAS